MTEVSTVTLRVTGVRSQNPRGFGGAIFTGVPVDGNGSVVDAGAYFVVKANRRTLGEAHVERGQWWSVSGLVVERRTSLDGFELLELQVEAEAAHLAMPSGEHIVRFIADNPAFEGLGTVKARRLWERFGDRLYDLLDASDSTAFEGVLTHDASQRLVEAWKTQGQSRTLQWLQTQGFDLRLGRKVVRFFGADAQARVEEDPYRLLSFMAKWSDVDRLAREQFRVEANDPRRLRGAVEEACYRTFSSGHTVMLTADLMDQVTPLLGSPPASVRWRDFLALALCEGVKNGSFVQTAHGLQPLGALVMERQVARVIHERLSQAGTKLLNREDVDRIIQAGEVEDDIELNPEQRSAIKLAAEHAFVCITGGAGVGKTTVLKSLYRLYDAAETRILQVALAGRAAKRMQEATGRQATTIASFLNSTTVNRTGFRGGLLA